MSGEKNIFLFISFPSSNQLVPYRCFLLKFSTFVHVFSGMPYLHVLLFKYFSVWLAISTLLKVILLLPFLESLPRIPKTYFISNYSNYPESWYHYYRIKFFKVYIFKVLFSPVPLRLIFRTAEPHPPRSSILQSGLKSSLLWLCPNFNAYLVQSVFRGKNTEKLKRTFQTFNSVSTKQSCYRIKNYNWF